MKKCSFCYICVVHCTCRRATSNMVSASEYPEVVQAYLDKEVVLGQMVGGGGSAPGKCQIF